MHLRNNKANEKVIVADVISLIFQAEKIARNIENDCSTGHGDKINLNDLVPRYVTYLSEK